MALIEDVVQDGWTDTDVEDQLEKPSAFKPPLVIGRKAAAPGKATFFADNGFKGNELNLRIFGFYLADSC